MTAGVIDRLEEIEVGAVEQVVQEHGVVERLRDEARKAAVDEGQGPILGLGRSEERVACGERLRRIAGARVGIAQRRRQARHERAEAQGIIPARLGAREQIVSAGRVRAFGMGAEERDRAAVPGERRQRFVEGRLPLHVECTMVEFVQDQVDEKLLVMTELVP